MALSVEDMIEHPALHRFVRGQSQALLEAFAASPRISSVFATQQRWLLAHCGLALHFRRDESDSRTSLTAARFFDLVQRHEVASRNTADSFIKEMLKYQVLEYLPPGPDKRVRLMKPSDATLQALFGWAVVHLSTLDSLDGGGRLQAFVAAPDGMRKLHPLIADGLLSSIPVRQPERTFSLFTWLTNGGIVMEWLITGVDPGHANLDRIPTRVLSLGEFAALLKLSRTHLARKLRDAEALGSLGWFGERGQSVMWVSRDFYREYMTAQAVKLAIIDAAFDVCFRDASSA